MAVARSSLPLPLLPAKRLCKPQGVSREKERIREKTQSMLLVDKREMEWLREERGSELEEWLDLREKL